MQLLHQQTGQQEVLAHVLVAAVAKPLGQLKVVQQRQHRSGTLLHRIDQQATDALGHLHRDATGAPGDDRVPFHNDSETTSPKPSRIDFCTTTSERRWKALTSTFADPGEVGVDVDQGSWLATSEVPIRNREAPVTEPQLE